MKLEISLIVSIACAACSANVDSGSSGSSQLDQGGCFWDSVQSSSTNVNGCSSDAELENAAAAACSAKNGAIAAFEGDEACGKGSSREAKYECCPVMPPPPCFTTKVGDGKQCSSDAELDKLAVSACAAQSAKLVKISPDEACPSVPPEGASYFATIECCY